MSLSIEVVGQALLDSTTGVYDERLEERLRSYESQVGYLSALVQLLTIPDVPSVTRKAAAIRFRRIVMKKWTIGTFKDPTLNLIHESDRATVRANLVKVVVQEADPIVRQLLSTAVFNVAKQDYPATWSTDAIQPIVEVFQSNLQNGLNTPYALSGALQSLYSIVRVRRASIASNKAERAIQNDIYANLCSPLLGILAAVLERENAVVASGDAQHITWLFETSHIILKIISIAFQQVTLNSFKNPQNVNLVTQLLIQSARAGHLAYCVHLYQQHGDRAYNHSIFKRRKWAFRVLARLYRCVLRVTERSKAAALEQTQWNVAWKKGFQEYLLDATLNVLFQLTIPGYELRAFKDGLIVQPQPTSPHIDPTTQLPIDYRVAFSPDVGGPMMRIIQHLLSQPKDPKKFINKYIYTKLDHILPAISSVLMLSASDIDSFQENSLHFIEYTLNNGLVEQVNDVYYVCDQILRTLFSRKSSASQQFLEYLINQPLNRYKAIMATPNITKEQYVSAILSKDAAMRVFGGLSRVFDHDNFLNNTISFLKALLHEHLSTPPIQWQEPHLLECRVLWCFARFKPTLQVLTKQSEHPLHAEAVQAALSCASQCLSLLLPSPELKSKFHMPGLAGARIQASATLLALLSVPQVKENIYPFAAQLFLSLLEILEEFDDVENLNILFQQLIVIYKDSLFPVAQQVLARLVPKFMDLLKELMTADDNDDDDDFESNGVEEKYWAAVAQLSSMHTIVGAIGDNADALRMAEQYLLPVCSAILDNELSDYMEDAMTIVQCFTYYEEVISEDVWTLYPKIIRFLLSGNNENYTAMLPSLANYLSKDVNIFSRVLQWQEPGTKEIVPATPIDLFYKLIFSHFNLPDYNVDTWILQENSIHLLRTHLGWLPPEDKFPPDQIAQLLGRFIPCLLAQLGYSLFQTHPSAIATIPRDEMGRLLRDPKTATEKRRAKYAILVLDCIQTMIYKYPAYLIDQLCTTPAPAEVQPQGHQINCLQFILDCSSVCLPTSNRSQSLYINIIGLSTLLEWFSRQQSGTLDHSHMRTNILSVLLNGIISFRRVEDEEDGDSDDEENRNLDPDEPNDDDPDDNEEEEGVEADLDDDETIAVQQAERQQNALEEYARHARELAETTLDIYYNDNEFVTPLDSINFYRFSLSALSHWGEVCQAFPQHSQQEVELLRSLKDPQHHNYAMMSEMLDYIQSSADIWDQEQQEDDQEYKDDVERLKRIREEQLAQMRGH